MKRTKAYVSGIRPAYRIIIPDTLPAAVRAEFSEFDVMVFTRFRAAQLLANAINAFARTVKP